MARLCTWRNDQELKDDLEKYVLQGIQRKEMLDFLERDYSCHQWSIRILDRRLRFFSIFYIDKHVTLQDAREAVKRELGGPGCQLGYRAMRQKIRQKEHLKVPRDLVHNLMFDLAPEGLEERRPGAKKKKRGHFSTKGINWFFSLDGHDKMMGYQNSTFPLGIYGCIRYR